MKKLLILICIGFSIFSKIHSQVDTAFWFAAPWVTPDHWWREDIKLHISTFSAPTTTVRVRQPAATAPNKYDTTIVIGPNTTFDYTFWRDKLTNTTNIGFDSLEVRPADIVVPYGLYISSSSKITVVYDIITRGPIFSNPETFSLKGQNGLGTHFICPQQNKLYNPTLTNLAGTPAGIMQPKQQINIVASKPNTIVWITPKCNIVGHSANLTYSLTLTNSGDAYTIENAVQTTSLTGSNLSGTEITSNKPIAVTIADDSVKGLSGGCRDLIGDQISPVLVTGYDYILVKGFTFPTEAEGAYIVATQNTTSITINDGVTTTTVINKGDTYFYKTNQPLTYINANKKVYCLQMTGNGCELGEDQLPPLTCSGSTLVSFSRNTPQNFYLHVVCKSTALNTFTLNNGSSSVIVPIAAGNFTVVPGTATLTGGPYYGAQLNLSSTSLLPLGSYTIGNTANEFALGVFDGGNTTGGLFHYMSSFCNNADVTLTNALNSICVGSTNTIALNGNIAGAASTGTWTTNGTGTFAAYTSTLNQISTTYSLSNSDTLMPNIKFYLTSLGTCNPITDSLIIQINQKPQIAISANLSICVSTGSVALTSTITNAGSGNWSGGNGGIFGPASPITTYTPSTADYSTGSATFVITSQSALPGCSNTNKTLIITFISSPIINAISSPSVLCAGQTATITTNGANTYTITGNNFIVTPSVTTTYSITGTNSFSCISPSPAIVVLTVNPIPNLSVTANPTLICISQQSTLNANGASSYSWSPAIPLNGVVSPSTTTIYTVVGTDGNGCSKLATITLSVDVCAGISEMEPGNYIRVFPNPTNGIFTISMETFHFDSEYLIYNVLGKLIQQNNINSITTLVDLSKHPDGIYFIKIKESSSQRMIKIIKE